MTTAPARLARPQLAWAHYLRSHAERIYHSGQTATHEATKMILRKVQKGELGCEDISVRQIYRKNWSGLADCEQVQEALDLLADTDWMRREVQNTGGRDAVVYTFNPRGLNVEAKP
ncbi:MAG: hypothetical protein JO142_15005 [Burkholderiales bacterium]|nr:hypothetical protein [Burkholderiales bacterium]